MKKIVVLALLAGVVSCLQAPRAAARAAARDLADPEEIIVTGARVPMAENKLPAAVTVLKRADIEALQVHSLPELLQGVAGVDVTASGGYGKVTGIRIRGSESDHVLVLIDGVRLGSATLGIAAFEHLPPSQIERIEVVRGPRSSLWGSEALGGVIHIFTRQGAGESPRYSLDAGGGSYGAKEVTGGVSGAYGNFHYSAAASWFDAKGIDAQQPVPGFFGVDQPDADGYDNLSVHARGGYHFGASGALDVFLLRAEGNTEFDGNFQDESDFVQQVAGGTLAFSPLRRWRTSLRLSESRDEMDNFNPAGDFASRFDTRSRQLSWQNDLTLRESHGIAFGVDYRDDKVFSSTAYDRASRDNLGLFGLYHGNFQGHQLVASARWDDDQAFGDKTTGGVGWSYALNDGLRLYGSYSAAYKTPSFNELFFPGFSNPDLRPETAVSYEAGLDGWHDWFAWSARGYHTEVDDLIVFAPPTYLPHNVHKARITGVEGELSARWRDWSALLAVEWLDPQDKTTGKRLARRTKEKLTLDVTRDLGPLSLGARVFAAGSRFDDAGNFVKMNGFATLDLLGEWRLNQRLTLRAKVANLLDKDYQTINTYNSYDRNFFVSFHYRSR